MVQKIYPNEDGTRTAVPKNIPKCFTYLGRAKTPEQGTILVHNITRDLYLKRDIDFKIIKVK